jgi:hypothetical protein
MLGTMNLEKKKNTYLGMLTTDGEWIAAIGAFVFARATGRAARRF